MILFVTQQAAGAEYLLPLLGKWRERSPVPWHLVAGEPSASLWERHGFKPVLPSGDPHVWMRKHWGLWGPSLVVVSSSLDGRLERAGVAMASEQGAVSAQFLDQWMTYRTRFFQGEGSPLWPDWIFAIDQRCKEEMISEGLPAERIRVVGQPALESFLQESSVASCHPERVLLASQPISKQYGSSLGYTEREFIRVCLAALPEAMPGASVKVTLHPEEEVFDLPQPKGIEMEVSRGRGGVDVLESGTVLGMSSTVMILAYLAGRRVLSVQPGLSGPDHCPLSRWGIIPRLESVPALIAALRGSWDQGKGRDLSASLRGSLERLEGVCLNLVQEGRKTRQGGVSVDRGPEAR